MAASWSIVEEKRALRRAMRARREGMSADERARAAVAVAARLASLPELAAARVVSGYLATRGELDPSAALAAAAARGAVVAYPRVSEERPRLRFHRVSSEADLRLGAFGILEPPPDAPELPLEALDLVLVPGLAFDGRGGRLGYGGGYYDEVAARLRAAGRGFLVGVGFDFQLIESCPAGEGDVAIDCVVTDARLCRRASEGKQGS
jgi:5-formyltetrahydrofolate cyclo-ligase